MIYCKELPGREFASKAEMFKAIVDNKASIILLKKSAIKNADGFSFGYIDTITDKEITKANEPINNPDLTETRVKIVINTTGLLDSHGDVHIKDLWKRSLDHSSKKLHLQEHERAFDKVISDDADAYVKMVSWKSLGAEFEGNTQALIFESTVKASRNPEMFKQYKNGWVKNHSVGMRYIDLKICINSDERWAEEYKKNWDEYYPLVANKDAADEAGFFWAVTEAAIVEGSAVVAGSNWVTPTQDNNMKSAPAPSENTDPPAGTQTEKQKIDNLILNL